MRDDEKGMGLLRRRGKAVGFLAGMDVVGYGNKTCAHGRKALEAKQEQPMRNLPRSLTGSFHIGISRLDEEESITWDGSDAPFGLVILDKQESRCSGDFDS